MEKLRREITDFVDKQDWNKFHSPKNLAMALAVEAAELMEIFQWMSGKDSYQLSPENLRHAEEEIGDVMIYLTILAESLGLEPLTAARKKLKKNACKYPTDDTQLVGRQ